MISYCEEHGIYEIWSKKGNVITYYSYYTGEGFYKVVHNLKTGSETRTKLRFKKVPKYLLGRYNYCCG